MTSFFVLKQVLLTWDPFAALSHLSEFIQVDITAQYKFLKDLKKGFSSAVLRVMIPVHCTGGCIGGPCFYITKGHFIFLGIVCPWELVFCSMLCSTNHCPWHL